MMLHVCAPIRMSQKFLGTRRNLRDELFVDYVQNARAQGGETSWIQCLQMKHYVHIITLAILLYVSMHQGDAPELACQSPLRFQ